MLRNTLLLVLLFSQTLGGQEITAIYGVKGQEDKSIPYLSRGWMNMLSHTLEEAERFDLGIDLANSSDWPFG